MRSREVVIGGVPIGPAHPPFVIAEVSGNHNGSLDRALAIVDAAAEAGAHALKLQTYTADTMTIDCDLPAFRLSDDHQLWGGAVLYGLYEEAHTPWEWHAPLFERARQHGMVAFSSPFDATAVAFLESLDVPAYKVASSELVDLPLIKAVAETGKPVILSTGMGTLEEIGAAVRTVRDTGNDQVIVLRCTVSYPAPVEHSNVRSIPVVADAFDCVVGLSDHTYGFGASVAAVAMGASVLEKHVTLDRADGGVDSDFSLEPAELAALVRETRNGWLALGHTHVGPSPAEAEGLRFRRSLYVVEDVKAGDPVTVENVRSIRPAGGLLPGELPRVLGRTFSQDVARGTALTWELV
jgi:pseudaminic acid synthase